MKRILFRRVERWINGLAPEYRTREFVKASLGLLAVVGLPINYSRLTSHE